jgi:hypothetical protein
MNNILPINTALTNATRQFTKKVGGKLNGKKNKNKYNRTINNPSAFILLEIKMPYLKYGVLI